MGNNTRDRRARTLALGTTFLNEIRYDLEQTAKREAGCPPRLRAVHERAGHATPEFRTFNLPAPEEGTTASPELLSGLITEYSRSKAPCCLMLGLDLLMQGEDGAAQPLLVIEAKDCSGNRLFWMQPYRVEQTALAWGDPQGGGWQDPGEEEMILDGAYLPPPNRGAAVTS